MRSAGVEPARPFEHQPLMLAWLPLHHERIRVSGTASLDLLRTKRKVEESNPRLLHRPGFQDRSPTI